MAEDLEALRERVDALRQLHLQALGSYHALVQTMQFLAPNIVGEDQARRNAHAFTRYTGYLAVARHALTTDVYIELAKIYDNHKDALTITKVLNYAVSNHKALTAQDEKLLNDPGTADGLTSVYEGLSAKDRQTISDDLAGADDKIKRLKKVRDKIIAHHDLKGLGGIEELSYDDLNDLIKLHEKIINTISVKYYGETMAFSFYGDDVISGSKSFFDLIAKDYDDFRSQFDRR